MTEDNDRLSEKDEHLLQSLEASRSGQDGETQRSEAWRQSPTVATVHGYFDVLRSRRAADRVLRRFLREASRSSAGPETDRAWPASWKKSAIATGLALLVTAAGMVNARRAAPALQITSGAAPRALAAGARVVAAAGDIEFGLPRVVHVRARPGCRLGVLAVRARSGGGLSIELEQEQGAAIYEVEPSAHVLLVVRLGNAWVRVIGTRFRLALEKGVRTIAVADGTVEVEAHGAPYRVTAGYALALAPDGTTKGIAPFNRMQDPDLATTAVLVTGSSR